jgi:uncharacterized protein YjbI with pentapeptide repeats
MSDDRIDCDTCGGAAQVLFDCGPDAEPGPCPDCLGEGTVPVEEPGPACGYCDDTGVFLGDAGTACDCEAGEELAAPSRRGHVSSVRQADRRGPRDVGNADVLPLPPAGRPAAVALAPGGPMDAQPRGPVSAGNRHRDDRRLRRLQPEGATMKLQTWTETGWTDAGTFADVHDLLKAVQAKRGEGSRARAYLADAHLAGANLAGAYMSGAYMAGAYLAGAYLADADLAGADMSGANLVRADLAGADMAGANMARANMARAHLADANLVRADLAGADLAGAYMAGANMAGANLAGANMVRAYMARADLAGADLAGANLAGAYLRPAGP